MERRGRRGKKGKGKSREVLSDRCAVFRFCVEVLLDHRRMDKRVGAGLGTRDHARRQAGR